MDTAVEDHVEVQGGMLEEAMASSVSASALPRRIALIEKYKAEIKIAKETLKEALAESPEYEAAVLEVQSATQKKKQLKDQLWSGADHQGLIWKIKENQEEIATLEEILTTELMQLFQTQNIDQVIDENGEPRKFKVLAKLLPKVAKKNPFGDSDQNPGMIIG